MGYGWVRAMLIMVKKACWIRWEPSRSACENCLQVIDSKMVGNKVVLSLQMCETETAADVRKLSMVTV